MGQGAGMVKPIYGAHSELVALATYFAPCGRRYVHRPSRRSIPIGNPARRRNGTDRIGIPRKSDSEVGTSDKRRNDLVGMNYSLLTFRMVENPGHNFRRTSGPYIASHTIGQPIRVRPAHDRCS